MQKYKTIISMVLIAITVTIFFLLSHNNTQKPKVVYKVVYKDKVIYKEPKNSLVSITVDDLRYDLKNNYTHISKKNREVIINTILKVSEKYGISPIVLYSLIHVESSFRWWVLHKSVKINGKRERAIGLGGIVWSWWGDKLLKNKIVETKADLFNISNNIEAIGYILNSYYKMPLKKGTSNKVISSLRRYFGGNYIVYTNKIQNKISKIVLHKTLQYRGVK